MMAVYSRAVVNSSGDTEGEGHRLIYFFYCVPEKEI